MLNNHAFVIPTLTDHGTVRARTAGTAGSSTEGAVGGLTSRSPVDASNTLGDSTNNSAN